MCARGVEKIVPERLVPRGERAKNVLAVVILVLAMVGLLVAVQKFVAQRMEAIRIDEIRESLDAGVRATIEERIAEGKRLEMERQRLERIKTSKLVALTFDDGPSSETTGRLLDILRDAGVKATFFVVGNRVTGNPELVRREMAEGHEVGSHTTAHVNFSKVKTAGEVINEMAAMRQIMVGATGREPRIMRPPYGNGIRSAVVTANVGLPMIHWSVDTLDWKYKDPISVRERALAEVYDGAIILMHDIHPTTVDAVPSLIEALRAQGYEFVTISELAEIRGVAMQAGKTYFYFKP